MKRKQYNNCKGKTTAKEKWSLNKEYLSINETLRSFQVKSNETNRF